MPADRLLMLVPLLAMLFCAAAIDLRRRRIPNWLSFSLILTGWVQSLINPAISPAQSALGLLCGFALAFVLFGINALGGGDVKLLAGVGAWIGPQATFIVFAAAAIVGLVMVVAQSLAQRRLRLLLRNSAMVAINVWHMDTLGMEHAAQTGASCRSVDRPLPYAVPVLLAVLLLIAGRMLWQM